MKKVLLSVIIVVGLFSGICVSATDWKLQKDLYDAIKKNDVKQIEAILAKHPAFVKKEIKYHSYPVLDAANLKAIKSLKCLVDKGANLNQKDTKTGNTVLHYIAASRMKKEKMDEALNYLLKEKNMKLEIKNKKGKTPFIYAFSDNTYVPSVKHCIPIIELFSKYGANLNAQDEKGKTALHYMVSTFLLARENPEKTDLVAKMEAAKLLADQKGINVNLTDKDKRTPLVAFLVHVKKVDDDNKVDFITCLMENGAKNNIKSKKKEKALKLVDKKSKAYAALKKRYKKKKK